MTELHMLKALQEVIYYVVFGVCIVTVPVLIVGIVASIFQAATQINEMTLTFIPKFLVMFVLLFMISPWLMNKLIYITHRFMENLPNYIR